MEGVVEYSYDNEVSKIDKKHDKIFKDILQNKKEMAKFITHFVGNIIKASELELYNTNFITNEYKSKEADIVYKVKGQEIYYLIEHQTKVDNSMSYRILNYCVEIIRNVVKSKNIKTKLFRYPIIIPIVLYAGNEKWTASTEFVNLKERIDYLNESKINVKYTLIDVNNYDEKELLEQKTMLGNAMLLEKCNSNDEVFEMLVKIIDNTDNKKILDQIKRIIVYIYGYLEKVDKLYELINESEVNKDMSSLRERLEAQFIREKRTERKEGRKEGMQEGEYIKEIEIIKNMLNMNFEDKLIKEATGADDEKIKKVKAELNMA